MYCFIYNTALSIIVGPEAAAGSLQFGGAVAYQPLAHVGQRCAPETRCTIWLFNTAVGHGIDGPFIDGLPGFTY